jgi:hypothetical protein
VLRFTRTRDRLRPGVVIEIWVIKGNFIGRVQRYEVTRRRLVASSLCAYPTEQRSRACPRGSQRDHDARTTGSQPRWRAPGGCFAARSYTRCAAEGVPALSCGRGNERASQGLAVPASGVIDLTRYIRRARLWPEAAGRDSGIGVCYPGNEESQPLPAAFKFVGHTVRRGALSKQVRICLAVFRLEPDRANDVRSASVSGGDRTRFGHADHRRRSGGSAATARARASCWRCRPSR